MMQRIHRRTLQSAQSLLRKYNARDHLEETVLPTFHFQGALPRLPVPDLEQTLTKYVESLEALEGHPEISKEDINRVKNQVKDFLVSDGPKLHAALKSADESNPSTSFYYSDWTDMYLSDRRPLPVNYNPCLHWKNLPNPELNEQPIRAAQICWAAAKYFLTLRDGHLKPEVFYLKEEPSDRLVKLTKYLPKFRVSIKSKGIDNIALRYLPFASV
jgi:carnitine O-palmitoyltransferase 2